MARAVEYPCFCVHILTVMLCATVSNRDGGWGGIVINRFDSEGTILLFC